MIYFNRAGTWVTALDGTSGPAASVSATDAGQRAVQR
jgi:hypothetical protein